MKRRTSALLFALVEVAMDAQDIGKDECHECGSPPQAAIHGDAESCGERCISPEDHHEYTSRYDREYDRLVAAFSELIGEGPMKIAGWAAYGTGRDDHALLDSPSYNWSGHSLYKTACGIEGRISDVALALLPHMARKPCKRCLHILKEQIMGGLV